MVCCSSLILGCNMRRYNLINFSLMLINPVMGFFSSLMDLMKLRDASFYFAFSVALIAVYFPIMYDTSVNFYAAYYSSYIGGLNNWLMPYLSFPSYLMYKYGVDFYYFLFLNVFFVVYVWTRIIIKNFSLVGFPKRSFFVLIFLLLTFNYRDLMDINRSIFSYSIFFSYIFLVERRSALKFLIFSLLAFWIHNSAFILIFLYFLSSFKFKRSVYLLMLIYSLFLGLFLPKIINLFSGLLNAIPYFGEAISYYFYGEEFGIQDFTLGTALKKALNCVFVLFSCYCALYLMKNNKDTRLIRFMILVGCVELIFLNFVSFFERMNLAFNFLYICLLSSGIKEFQRYILAFLIIFRSLCLYLFIYFSIFFGDYSSVMPHDENKLQMMAKPLYYPTPFLLNIHDNGYSDEFISSNSIWGR